MGLRGGVPILVDQDWEQATFIKDDSLPDRYLRLLFYGGNDVGFEHLCDRGPRGVVFCAPSLVQPSQPGAHQVTGTRECPTVRPSIVCPDCGIHGFITEGKWVAA
jgi:hypothetical protein